MTDIDSRSPQEKGKPSHRVAHSMVGRPATPGRPAHHLTPNRSGEVKIKHVAIDTPSGVPGKKKHHG